MPFRLKPYCSRFLVGLRIIDALAPPAVMLMLLRVSGTYHIGERAILLAIVASLLTALSLEAVGLYRRWRGAHVRREVHTILAGWALVAAGVMLVGLVTRSTFIFSTHVFAAWLLLSPVVISLAHVAGRFVLRLARTHGHNRRRAVIVGAGEVGAALARKFETIPWAGVQVEAMFDDDLSKKEMQVEGIRVLGGVDEVVPYVTEHGVDLIYLALPMRAEKRMQSVMEAAGRAAVPVYMVPDLFVFDLLGARILDIDGIPVVSLSESPQIGPAGAIKRLEDLILAALGLIVLFPVFLAIAIAIKRSGPGPVIFGHSRIGRNGRRFKCYKFRTMVENADKVLQDLLERDPKARAEWAENYKLKDDPRITKIGSLLRRTSLDELPQLFNVLKGEMSLVGPRPIVEGEIEKYGRYYRHLTLVRPGMTGLWQVSGRNDVTYDERVQMDVAYARNWSVWKDLLILGKTIKAVLARDGVY